MTTQASPPPGSRPGWAARAGAPFRAPGAAPDGLGRGLWILLAAGVTVVLVGAAVFGGYMLGRARATAAQPQAQTVSAPFVHFQLAPGWNVIGQTSRGVLLQHGADAFASVRLGDSQEDHVSSDADVFRNELYAVTQQSSTARVGSCLPVTRVTIGGKPGEEVGFAFRQAWPQAQENCDLVWAHVSGSRYYLWTCTGSVGGLSQRVSSLRAMERTAVWSR